MHQVWFWDCWTADKLTEWDVSSSTPLTNHKIFRTKTICAKMTNFLLALSAANILSSLMVWQYDTESQNLRAQDNLRKGPQEIIESSPTT